MSSPTTIIIADDHALFRQSLAKTIQTETQAVVAGQAGNGRALLRLLQKKVPDIILLDIEMPVMNGWETLKVLKREYPTCRVIVMSPNFEGLPVKELIAKGARGFLSGAEDLETLFNAIREVQEIGYSFPKIIPRHTINKKTKSENIPTAASPRLTDREIETLKQVCNDRCNREIAEMFQVSERTVERYKANLFEKTRARTPLALALYALKNRLV